MNGWFRYVLHPRVVEFEARGWAAAGDLGPVHGHWCVLMQWMGAGDPPETAQATGGGADPVEAEADRGTEHL